jgi:hypothetical protein
VADFAGLAALPAMNAYHYQDKGNLRPALR